MERSFIIGKIDLLSPFNQFLSKKSLAGIFTQTAIMLFLLVLSFLPFFFLGGFLQDDPNGMNAELTVVFICLVTFPVIMTAAWSLHYLGQSYSTYKEYLNKEKHSTLPFQKVGAKLSTGLKLMILVIYYNLPIYLIFFLFFILALQLEDIGFILFFFAYIFLTIFSFLHSTFFQPVYYKLLDDYGFFGSFNPLNMWTTITKNLKPILYFGLVNALVGMLFGTLLMISYFLILFCIGIVLFPILYVIFVIYGMYLQPIYFAQATDKPDQ